MRDANEYYLQQHLEETERLMSRAEWIDEMALGMIQDESCEFWPWTVERIKEAICEAPDHEIQRLIDALSDLSLLGQELQNVVDFYWVDRASDYLEKNLDD